MRAQMAKAPSAERRAAPSATSGGSPSPRQSQQRRCTGSSPSQHCSVHTCLRHHRQKRLGSLRLHLSHSVGVRGLGGTWPLRACAPSAAAPNIASALHARAGASFAGAVGFRDFGNACRKGSKRGCSICCCVCGCCPWRGQGQQPGTDLCLSRNG